VKERRPRFQAPSVGAISRSASTALGASPSAKSAGLPGAIPWSPRRMRRAPFVVSMFQTADSSAGEARCTVFA